ncbi:hypothetical protein BYT27DRAFT_7247113 [Phlegmacium glaucopus]|nr:hypothetical protein BYT27DRAFT_7247113 [Phlegmacium glaucopus]
MMWDIGGHGMSNTMSKRNRSRSPLPPQMRMPSPAPPIPHSEANATMGSSSYIVSTNSSYPPVAASPSYNPYVSHGYPSVSRAAPAPFPPTQIVHIVHHSKHHSSSKNKHHHQQHSGHGHSHSHTHSYSQPRLPSPSPMTPFPISPSTSFPMPSPHFYFPTVPHRPQIHPSTSNIVNNSSNTLPQATFLPPGYIQSIPTPKQSTPTKQHKLTKLPLNPHFQYSNCTGSRRALCIGINYRGQENELRGCINDANTVYKYLMKNNYRPNDIKILTDDTNDPRTLPTRKNILEAMHWLVRDAKPHDSLFFHYSGHGGQTRDLDGDEADGWDEVIFPLDFKRNGHIVDDVMHDIMVRPLPPMCRLTACHSGSVLDLTYLYSSSGRLRSSPTTRKAQSRKATLGDVISFSACQDGQTSADTFSGGVAVGAMSNAFISVLNAKPRQTYQELLQSIRRNLGSKYSQKPQLGSSHQINLNLLFIF